MTSEPKGQKLARKKARKKGAANPPSLKKAIRDAELNGKAAEAYTLRLMGYGFPEIGEHFGVSKSTAFEWVERGQRLRLFERVDNVIATHVDRIALMRPAFMQAAVAGDKDAADTIQKLDKREAELLGINPGEKVSVEVVDAKASLKAKIDQFMKRTGMGKPDAA